MPTSKSSLSTSNVYSEQNVPHDKNACASKLCKANTQTPASPTTRVPKATSSQPPIKHPHRLIPHGRTTVQEQESCKLFGVRVHYWIQFIRWRCVFFARLFLVVYSIIRDVCIHFRTTHQQCVCNSTILEAASEGPLFVIKFADCNTIVGRCNRVQHHFALFNPGVWRFEYFSVWLFGRPMAECEQTECALMGVCSLIRRE